MQTIVQDEQIVTFETPASVVKQDKVSSSFRCTDIVSALVEESREHSLVDFLARPVLAGTTNWDIGLPPNTQLLAVDFPDDLFNSPMYTQKLSNFRFIRYTMVFRVIVNASTFSTGRLLVWFEPFAPNRGDFACPETLVSKTGYPSVEVDAGAGNEAILRVPFAYPFAAFDLQSMTWVSTGRVRVDIFNSLRSMNGPTEADVTLYYHMEDVCLSVPTRRTPTPGPLLAKAHMMSEAEESAKEGTISAPLKKISEISGLVGRFPLGPVSEVADAIAWVSRLGAGAAEAFGYSKLRSEENNRKVTNFQAAGFTNFNNIDNSVLLGADAHNAINVDARLLGSNEDEMDINYVCSRPCFVRSFPWDSSDTAGTILTQFGVYPGHIEPTAAANAYATPICSYVSHMFGLWRGTMRYRLSVIRNNFYSGRLIIAFMSGETTFQTSPVVLPDFEALPKTIIDIRDNSDVIFDVPFVNKTPFLRTSHNDIFAAEGNLLTSQGIVVVAVQNRLRAPDTVPSNIEFNLYMSMKEPLFQVPDFNAVSPLYDASILPSPSFLLAKKKEEDKKLKKPIKALAHMYRTSKPFKDSIKENADNTKCMLECKQVDITEPGQLVCGEQVVSLRSLCRMFNFIGTYASAPGLDAIELDPAYMGQAVGIGVDPTLDRVATVGGIYAMYRGARRFKALSVDIATNHVLLALTLNRNGATNPPGPAVIADGQFEFTSLNAAYITPFSEIELPYYRDTLSSIRSTTAQANFYRKTVQFTTFVSPNTEVSIFSASSDNFTFGYLTGAPLVFIR